VSWSIQDVARLAGISSRTLRHYDAIGLLVPARVGSNGYRYYDRPQLLRLQHILLLRELGVGLAAIAEVLDGGRDELDALRAHHQRLQAESDRLSRLADTVARTIAERQGGTEMAAEELFAGFAQKRAELEGELVERYGDEVREHFAESERRTRSWTALDYASAGQYWTDLEARILAQLRAGTRPEDPEVQDLIDEHHAAVARFWTPTRDSYAGLDRLYVEHPEFRSRYDAQHPDLGGYLRDAIEVYARARLG
jgi:MerR family transcriptional regulator, thiopeptide resistance regulator